MKKFQLIFLIVFLSTYSFGQSLTYRDLKSLIEMNISDAQDFLIKKDFSFYEYEKKWECDNYNFSKERRNVEKVLSTAFLTFQICDNKNSVIYKLSNEKAVLDIKTQAKLEGLKFDKTINYNGSLVTVLSNSIHKLLVMSTNTDENFTMYEISLEKK